jgi:hypothetical protein
MGNDGGVRIFKIKELKEKWHLVRESIITRAKENVEKFDKYWYDEAFSFLTACEKLPENIDNMSNLNIEKMLQIFNSCDTPCLYFDSIVVAYGDYVYESTELFSNAICEIEHTCIETWT